MTITKTSFGKADGKNVDLYTLTNGNDVVAKVATYGATLVGLEAPDRDGKLADVVLGFDDLDGYLAGTQYFGSTVGRVANRIRNGRFELDGNRFAVASQQRHAPPARRHQGLGQGGLDAEAMDTADGPAVRLAYRLAATARKDTPATSPPAAVHADRKNELRVAMRATPTRPRWSTWRITRTGTSAGKDRVDHSTTS